MMAQGSYFIYIRVCGASSCINTDFTDFKYLIAFLQYKISPSFESGATSPFITAIKDGSGRGRVKQNRRHR